MKTPNQMGNKFDSKTWKGIHVGYEAGNAYRIFLPSSNKIVISRDVTFIDEEEVLASRSVDANIVTDSDNGDPDAEIIVPRKFNTETTTSDD